MTPSKELEEIEMIEAEPIGCLCKKANIMLSDPSIGSSVQAQPGKRFLR